MDPLKLLKYWKAVAAGLLIAYIGFLNVRLWYEGLDLGTTSLYSYKPAPYFAEHTKRWKKAKLEVFPCVKVQGVRSVSPEAPSTEDLSNPSAQTANQFGLGAIELGEWKLKRLPYGGIASAKLDSEGLTHLTVTPGKPSFLEVGGSRSLGLSVGMPLIAKDQNLRYQLYFRQDLLRIGPVWIQGQASSGTMNHSGTNDLDLSVQLNAEVRF